MKAGAEHQIPLAPAALAILHPLYAARMGPYVFAGRDPARPASKNAMALTLRRLGAGEYTAHGFRSSFRDWAGDATSYPREIAEMALAHRVGDATEQAYRRGSALQKRARLMQAWADFCTVHRPARSFR